MKPMKFTRECRQASYGWLSMLTCTNPGEYPKKYIFAYGESKPPSEKVCILNEKGQSACIGCGHASRSDAMTWFDDMAEEIASQYQQYCDQNKDISDTIEVWAGGQITYYPAEKP